MIETNAPAPENKNEQEIIEIVDNIDELVCNADSLPTESEKELIELEANIVLAEDVFEDEECLIEIDDVPTFPKADIVCVKAKQKHGKSTALAILTAALVSGEWNRIHRVSESVPNIIYIDTEMKKRDTWLLQQKMLQMAKKDTHKSIENVRFINLRQLLQDECREIIPKYMEAYHPDIVIIDGVVDLLTNFNDVEQSQTLVREIMAWAEKYNCCIVTVLHTNKNLEDNNMRGHLGTILSQKSALTFECVKDKSTNIITVKSDDCRHAPVPSWSFGFDENGIPVCKDEEVAESATRREANKKARAEKKKACTNEERKKCALSIVSEEGTSGISRAELTRRLEAKLNLGRSTISPLITELITDGKLLPKGYNGNLIVNNCEN